MAIQKIKEALPNTINTARSLPQNPSPAKQRLTSNLVISDYSHSGKFRAMLQP
jgi:hypothetical protein